MSSSDTSLVTNHFSTAAEGFVTTTGGSVNSGAAIIPLNTTSGLTNGKVFVGIIEPGTSGKEQTFTGLVDTSGSQITNVVWTRGTNTAHAAGVTVVDYVTGTQHNMTTKGILVEHSQDGTHGNITPDSVTTPTLVVTGNSTLPAGDIATADLANASVIPDKLGTGATSASVTTTETTASATYAALTTPGPVVTVTIGANGLALVIVGSQQFNDTNGKQNFHSVVLSGANTLASTDINSLGWGLPTIGAGNMLNSSRAFLLTGLNPGSTTFTSQYRVTGGTGTFTLRQLAVIPL